MGTFQPRRRATPRAQIAVDVALARGRFGADVTGRTRDLGPGGMSVATQRPLRVDEHLTFTLTFDDSVQIAGRAHVVREDARNVYGLRFDHLAAGDRERLELLVS